MLAATPPALAAARARSGAAVHLVASRVRRVRKRRTVVGLALADLARVPGRTALGVVALAVGVCALTMLVAVSVGFHNDVIGSLLGDVLYINVRERSAELVALWAAGWSDRALLRLVGYEGLGIGVLGALAGAAAGLGGIAWFVGELNAGT